MNLQPTQHLNHQQLCDALFGEFSLASSHHDAAACTTVLSTIPEAHQEHLRSCLICASELELMRTSITSFQVASNAVADRELVRHPIQKPFASLYGKRSHAYATPVFVWATAALVFATLVPLGLLNPQLNPLLKHPVTTQPATSNTPSYSDADLLNGIDEDLSAAVPAPMQPLAGPAVDPATEPESPEVQRTN